ncbi:MAG: methyl-accepting chemotaxis protein [Deltaproteobacteria bacterium]|nr:methyl-accepting chemotaxis protein [Deltaproteobacteria bacterium]
MKFKRFHILTHKPVQMKLASVFLLWFIVFIASFLLLFAINFSMASSRTQELSMVHDRLLTNAILVDQTKNLAFYYGIASLVYFVLVWIYMLVYSHRLTGPVFKLTHHLDRATKAGEIPKPIKFRKSDAFHELAESFNHFVVMLEKERPTSSKPK